MNGFEKLLRIFEQGYYAVPIMSGFELIAIIVGLKLVRKDKTGVFFIAYLIFDFLIAIADNYLKVSPLYSYYQQSFFISLTNQLISLAELLVYYFFFFHIIQNKIIIRLMKITRMIFIFVIVIAITTHFSFLTKRYSYISLLTGCLEFLFLLPPCFVYFYEILKNNPAINLYQRPSFWIVTGIFFFSVMSVPYYLITQFVSSNHYEYTQLLDLSFYYVPFTINFIFLTRAFLCKKTLTI